MHVVLIGELGRVGDADVRLALVVEQLDLDCIAVDPARRVDRLELVHDHLTVFLAGLRLHAKADADLDDPGGGRARSGDHRHGGGPEGGMLETRTRAGQVPVHVVHIVFLSFRVWRRRIPRPAGR